MKTANKKQASQAYYTMTGRIYEGYPKRFAVLSIFQSISTGGMCNFLSGQFWISRLLLQRCGTIRFLAHAQEVVKMA